MEFQSKTQSYRAKGRFLGFAGGRRNTSHTRIFATAKQANDSKQVRIASA
jgi:hypothetical protein